MLLRQDPTPEQRRENCETISDRAVIETILRRINAYNANGGVYRGRSATSE